MSFKSKRTAANLAAGTVLAGVYLAYALSEQAPSQEDIVSWARVILIFIGISAASVIVIQILFHIVFSVSTAVKQHGLAEEEIVRIIESDTAEDELDKLISLRSSRAGYICAGAGFAAALISLAFMNASAAAALHILLFSAFAGSFTEGCISISFYERGVRNG